MCKNSIWVLVALLSPTIHQPIHHSSLWFPQIQMINWSIDHSSLWLPQIPTINRVFDLPQIPLFKPQYHPLNNQSGLWLPWIPLIKWPLWSLITLDAIDQMATLFFDYLRYHHLNLKYHLDRMILGLQSMEPSPDHFVLWCLRILNRIGAAYLR